MFAFLVLQSHSTQQSFKLCDFEAKHFFARIYKNLLNCSVVNKKMKINIARLIEESDLVLVDNSFLNGAEGNLSEKIYQLRHPSLLAHYFNDLAKNNQHLQWMRDEIISKPHVFSVPAIINEIKNFKRYLDSVWEWGIDSNHWVTVVQKNETRKKSLELMIEEETTPIRRRKVAHGLNPLWQYRHLIQKIARQLNVYEGETFNFPRHRPEIADADYQLFGAGIQILLEDQDPGKKVSLLTRDHHHLQIIEECYRCKIPIEGKLAVYNFCEWQGEEGYIPLKSHAVYQRANENVRLRSNL